MNKALYGILGFILGILVFTSVNNGNLFTDASESTDGLIEQLDAILASPKFDNREYSVSIMEKTDTLAAIFEENTIPYLAMKYINASLKVKIDSMPVTTTIVEEIPSEFEEEGKEEAHESADDDSESTDDTELSNDADLSDDETEVTTSNDYNSAVAFPLTQKEKNPSPVSNKKAADLEGFNVGRQKIPSVISNSVKKTISNPEDYKYQVDADLYNFECAQKRCVEACINLDAGYSESLCNKECISLSCMDVKRKGKLDMREVK